MSQCIHKSPIGYRIGGTIIVPAEKCTAKALPGMLFCYEHADKETMAYVIKWLFNKFKELNPAEAGEWDSDS